MALRAKSRIPPPTRVADPNNIPPLEKKIIVIVGPTASGKSAIAVNLAKKVNGEIISADSRQVYKGLNLASGKITKKEMSGIRHHCLDLVSPKIIFTAARFSKCARRAIKDILQRQKTPIIVGGTGFYIDVALEKIKIPEIVPDWRLRQKLKKKSPRELFLLLKKLDPRRAKNIDRQNTRRLIRAIEIAKSTNKKVANQNQSTPQMIMANNVFWLGIKLKPEELREKIKARLAHRLKAGMVNEIKRLHENGISWKRLEALGLEPRWISKYLRGKTYKEEMIEKLQTATWRYSRRQMTWFSRNKKISWVRVTPSKILDTRYLTKVLH